VKHPRTSAALTIVLTTAVGATALIGLTASPTEAATPAAVADIPQSDYDIQVRLRQEFGFDSSASHIAEVNAGNYSRDRLGIPLTADEDADMARRAELSPIIQKIDTLLEPTGLYGGGWIDNKAGGQVVVAYVGDLPSTVRATVTSLVGLLATTTFKTVKQSADSLYALESDIANSGLSAELAFEGSGVDLVNSTVTVDLSPDSPQKAEEILSARYGDKITVSRDDEDTRKGDLSREFNSGPLYGGQWISAGNRCTDGYSNVRDSVGRYYTITAGHCWPNGTVIRQGSSSSNRAIGNTSSSTGRSGVVTNCDCLVIGEIPSGTGTEQTRVNNNNLFRFTQSGNAVIGDAVCQAGANFAETNGFQACGQVTARGQTRVINAPGGGTFEIRDQIKASYGRMTGDSGAPVGRGTSLVGFHSSGDSTGGWFSQSRYVGQVNVSLGY
jgi:hypothetical protein